jgi:hypothetical protein
MHTLEKPDWPNYPARLRKLRYILGKDGKLLPGDQFAARTGMSASTLRATETGLRKLHTFDEDRIVEHLGAVWSDEKDGWYCVGFPEKPYTAEFYRFYASPTDDQLEEDPGVILDSLEVLKSSLPLPQYRGALLAVYRFIRKIAREASIPPDKLEFIEFAQPIRLKRPKPSPKTQHQRRAAKETTFSPTGGNNDQNSAAASLETKPK